jgi:hypothetical protein
MQRAAPPSTYAIQALLEGQKGALLRVGQTTLTRTAFIAPGLYLAGLRGRDLVRATAYASLSITAGLVLYYAWGRPKK